MNKTTLIAIVCCVLPIAIIGLLFAFGGERVDHSLMPPSDKSTDNKEPSLQRAGVRIGNTALDFSFTTVDGQTVALSSLRGQPVIISFVLTVGCVPCKAEALNIRVARKQFPNLKVIQLAVNHRETAADLKNFRDSFGSQDWLIGFDDDLKIAELYEVRAVDTTILMGADGQILYRDDGYPIETWTLIQKLSSQP